MRSFLLFCQLAVVIRSVQQRFGNGAERLLVKFTVNRLDLRIVAGVAQRHPLILGIQAGEATPKDGIGHRELLALELP